jgi:hypothetical protein
VEPSIELVPLDSIGPGTGTAGLIPAPPISVAPSGMPTRPTVDSGAGTIGVIVVLLEQPSDEPPDNPPPSNKVPDDPLLSETAQLVTPGEGLIGDTPGVTISVEPSGMPAGRVEPRLSDDVADIPAEGCVVGSAICACDAVGVSHIRLAASAALK